jgi:DNA-binding NarL/FixJ family response regulator
MVQWSLWARALAHYERGEPAEADRAATACLEVLREVDESTMTLAGRANIAAIRSEHDPQRAIDDLLVVAGPRLEAIERTWRTWLLFMLVRAAVATGRLDDAAGWLDGAQDAAPLPASRARVHCALAELRLAEGDAGAARAAAGRALALVSFEHAPREALIATILEGRAAAAGDARDDAIALLKDAARRAGTLGAQRLAGEAHRELRRLGVRAAASIRHAGGGAQLSARERDIAQLAAAGRSNRQIAAALFLSEKTVENNLSRIYAKLAVRSRVELTARWAELDQA